MVSGALHAQTFFRTIGTATADESGQCIVALQDGNYAIGGSKRDSALVTKVDGLGNVIWSRSFRATAGYDHVVYQLASAPDGSLIGTGNAYDGNPYPEFSFLFKFDLNGNLIWHTRSDDSRPIWTNRILPTPGASYMALPCIYDLSSTTLSDLYTASVDASTGLMLGNGPRTDFTPSNPGLDEHYSATIAPDGSVYACGRVFMYGDDPASMRPHVTHYNAAGGVLWSKYYMYPVSETARIYAIDIIHNEDSLAVCYFGNIDGASAVYNVGLIRMDELGNVAWTKDYDLPDFTSDLSYKVLRMPYGYAITGYGTGERDLFVLAVDLSGNVLWCNKYGMMGTSEFLPRTVTPNAVAIGSDVLFTGTRETSGDRDIIVARIDATGDVSCLISQPIDVIVTNVAPFTDDLTPVEYPDVVPFEASDASTSVQLLQDGCSLLALDLGPDQTACGPIDLDATLQGASYLWSDGSTSAMVTISSPDTAWVVATIGCCSVSDTLIIHPGETPVAGFDMEVPSCGLDVGLSSTSQNATSLEWDLGDGTIDEAVEFTHPYGEPGEFELRLIAFNGCGSDTITQFLTVVSGGTLDIVAPSNPCVGADVELSFTLTDDTPVSQSWSTGGTGTNETINELTEEIVLELTVEGTSGCFYTQELVLTPTSLPTAGFSYVAENCGTSVQYSSTSSGAAILSWDLGNGSTSDLAAPVATYPLAGTFDVQLVATNSCGSDSADTVISTLPQGQLTTSSDTTICNGTFIVLSLFLANASVSSISWSTGEEDIGSITLVPSSDISVSVDVIDDEGCSYTGTTVVALSPLPSAEFSYSASPCESTVELENNSTMADSFEWFVADQFFSIETDPVLELVPGPAQIIFLVALNSCGSDTTFEAVTLPPLPYFGITGPEVICESGPIELEIAYGGIGDLSILWSTGQTSAVIELVPVDGTTIQASAATSDGCQLTATFPIDFVGDGGSTAAYVPNVFTPNNDGLNEFFAPVILSGFESLTIFNRWGEELYVTTDLQKPWKGDYKSRNVPDGTYVYIVSWKDACSGQREERVGHVTLLR